MCNNSAEIRVHTIYGPLSVCRQCVDSHPIPYDMKKGIPDILIPWSTRQCECENIIHFPEQDEE